MTPPEPSAAEQQLAVLFPEPEIVPIAGTNVLVREMPVRKIARFTEALAPTLARYPDATDVFALFLAAGPKVMGAVAYAVDQPEEWIAELPPRLFQTLCRKLQEKNADFFVSGVGFLVSGAMATLWSEGGGGQTSSTSSSSTDTTTPVPTP